jgi:hypothetical protein
MDLQLLAAELGVFAGVFGAYAHRRKPARGWLPHLFMAGAMVGMALPRHDPLGPAGWMLVLGCAAGWALGRPGSRRARLGAAAALDLYAMGVLTLLMPAVHRHHAHGAHAVASGFWQVPYAALLAVWLLARGALALRDHRVAVSGANASVSSACSGMMIAAMALMAFGV